uniref:Tubulin monoglycylase TTLL3 n=1 Tax=Strix occidentalis caurina TaxID=311401 RepID=A0A8D0G1Y0_STROC
MVSGTPGSVRQRQAGRRLLPPPCPPRGAGDLEPVGSARPVLAGRVAPATAGHRGYCHPLLDPERLKRARLHVERAIKEKKIFTVQGPYPVIRRLLRARGWVERKLPGAGSWPERRRVSQEKQQEEEGERWDEDPDGIHDLMSRLVRDQVPYFIWTNRCDAVDRRLLRQDQLVNHYARVGAFTTKDGLCLNLRNLPWFDQADPDTFFPRCYRLGAVDDRQAFIGEFRAGVNPPGLSPSCSRSLLKVALERAGDTSDVPHPMPSTAGPGTPLSPQLVEEALQVCGQHLGSLGHQDIDGDPQSPATTGIDRDHFLQDYYRVVHGAQRERCRALLQCLAERLPQLGMEGDHNIWILKPGAKSRGRGIVCVARLEEVLRLAGGCVAPLVRAGKWVVQKYVERPLLIFGTKFDIRQWFLVTDWNPLTVWFYRESYLRFCSQPFSLHRLDPARHLCNVSIQKQCRPARGQHPQLPPDQIWSCQQLQAYLAQVGRTGAWDQVMVPGMKAAVVGALRSAQDQVGSRKSSFELYGADFVFGEDCQPWLLEINASPTLAPSSAVTSRLCASVQRDMLHVVIDRRDNPACPTGAFELIYKEVSWGGVWGVEIVGQAPPWHPKPVFPHHVPLQTAVPVPLYVGLKLMVEGCCLRKPQPAQHRYQGKAPSTAPSAPQPPVPPNSWGRATGVPQPGAAQGELPPLGRWSRRCPPGSAPPAPPQPPDCCAGSQGLRQLSCLLRQPQAALPQLCVRPLPRAPVPLPQGVPGSHWGPKGQPPPSSPLAGVLRLPGLAPSACTPSSCPGQPSPAVRRTHRAALRGTQKSCDAAGHPGGASTLPAATRRHPATPHSSQTPSLRGGTQPTPRRGCKTRL